MLQRAASRAAWKLQNKSYFPPSAWFSVPLAREKQLPPAGEWRIWLILAGRGFGKTRSVVEWALERARTQPGSTGVLAGATASDVYKVLVAGESGVLKSAPDAFRPLYNSSKSLLTFPNGTTAWLLSAEEPDRFRGLNTHWAACDELAAWRYADSWDQLLLGLRLGDDPRVAIATTPRPTLLIKQLLKDPTVAVTRGSTYENKANLAPAFLTTIVNRYEGTTLGRQELNAEILDDMPGALWKRTTIETERVTEVPELRRIVVAIDPAVTANAESAETGIIAAGVGEDGQGYILDDKTISASPDGWAKQAVALYHTLKADRIVAEVNNGGDMIEHTIRTVDSRVAFTQVRASRGKHTRAEPVAALYEQGKVHHVGAFGLLEDQMCQWTPTDADSPDRVDALVWALTELMLDGGGEMSVGDAPRSISEYFGL